MITLEHLHAALALTDDVDTWSAKIAMAPAQRLQMKPNPKNPPRESAVLVLNYPDNNGDLNLLLTKRADSLRGHSGQVSFPGGRHDPEDPTYEATALRETCEELGICRDDITLIGSLEKLWIPPSNFDVYPFVATIDDEPELEPNPDEVEQVLKLSLTDLLDPTLKKTTPMTFGGVTLDVPYYDVDGYVVWGATCMMLSELEARLRHILDSE